VHQRHRDRAKLRITDKRQPLDVSYRPEAMGDRMIDPAVYDHSLRTRSRCLRQSRHSQLLDPQLLAGLTMAAS
jgi:hypothetical protein